MRMVRISIQAKCSSTASFARVLCAPLLRWGLCAKKAASGHVTTEPPTLERAARDAEALVRRVLAAAPLRPPCSAGERRAQELLADELTGAGAKVDFEPFRFSTNLYRVIAAHFFAACLGTVALLVGMPWLALPLHALAAISYTLDSARLLYILRPLLGRASSQNLVATTPAQGERRLRLVFLGHADAAPTGLLFHPEMIRRTTNMPTPKALGFLRRLLVLPVLSSAVLAALDLVVALELVAVPRLAVLLLTIPPLIATLLNGQLALFPRIVPGANDNLTGCAAVVALSQRLADLPRRGVELVFVVTGCEEAGTGGAWALARARAEQWSRGDTVIIGVDSLSNGELRWFEEGEVLLRPTTPWLGALADEVAAGEPSFSGVRRFDIPAGATDVLPFLVRGFDGICFGCVDPRIGAPREYHRLTDDADHCDWTQCARSFDFVEAMARAIVERKAA